MNVIRKDLLDSTNKAVTEEQRAGTWYLYEQYEFKGGSGERYFQAPPAFLDATGHPNPWRWPYEPLVRQEDLFLIFARWPEDHEMDGSAEHSPDTDRNAEAAREWVETYGVLGLTLREPAQGKHSRRANPAGGEGDTVARFTAEAWAAHRALRLYEAATRSAEAGGVDVEAIISLTPVPVHRDSLERFPEEAREFALKDVVHEIHDRAPYYSPALYWPETRDRRPTGEFAQGWRFTNLLGAMWLQALWLLAAGPDSVRHCSYPKCNRIIAYEQPEKPFYQKKGERKPYKTRTDKEYCNNTCVQRNHRMKQRLRRTQ